MIRENILSEVIKILHGPIGGIGEELNKNPLDFYSVGVLFPQLPFSKEYEDNDEETVGSGTSKQTDSNEEISTLYEDDVKENNRAKKEKVDIRSAGELELTTKFRPSAIGISVLVNKSYSIDVEIKFGKYEKKTREKTVIKHEETRIIKEFVFKHFYQEFSFAIRNNEYLLDGLTSRSIGSLKYIELDESADLVVATRPYIKIDNRNDLEIKTFTLINKHKAKSFGQQKNAINCLFQPSISITCSNTFHAFDDLTNLDVLGEEDINLKLLYRNYAVYAQGHGISVNWENSNEGVKKVFTQVLPQEHVNGVDLNPEAFKKCDALFIKRLGGKPLQKDYDWKLIRQELSSFIDLYKEWITEQHKQIADIIEPKLRSQAEKNLGCCLRLYERMSNGIQTLSENDDARKAFEDANRAMFMQRVMSDFSRHRRKMKRVQNNDPINDDPLPDFSKIPFDSASGSIWKDGKLNIDLSNYERSGTMARWRPFQLAFLLSQIEGIINPNSDDRNTVDLIWFPTGGGKTEAYLGLTAFTIFFRRLNARTHKKNPDKGAGVSVLMRYTLRLLNKQQFERSAILICSCDLIRRDELDAYGRTRISNGIWMGRSMTPNSETNQQNHYGEYIRLINKGRQPNIYKNSPPLLSCPCCGNRLIKEFEKTDVIGRWGYFRLKNSRGSETGPYLMACTNTKCDFYVTADTFQNNRDKSLPIFEVDDTIYRERPSLLFSTVDKFVQLAWNSEAFNLFNIDLNSGQVERLYPPPDLVIQDELHLISSALGTVYGVYEIVVDQLCRESQDHLPKIVGATATVRNAEEQTKRLYGRKHFMQFPPPAINADDSFFAKKIKEYDPKNRLYVGFMPSGITTSTALIRLTSVLLERIPALNYENEELDDYYTLIVYFNALKELGKFRTFLTDDIVAYRKLLANHFNTCIKPFDQNSLCELSSVMTADDITKGLDRLEKTTLPGGLNTNKTLVKKLFEAGIRTKSMIRAAKGIRNIFLNKTFFEEIGLKFSEDQDNYKVFFDQINKTFPEQIEPIQIAPATNMISVGVDIPRLNTMIINGQPKTAAEYIQASSRVGRETKGIVFTFLAPTKNRDRSHYEQFKAFHQSYYYYVEASSVTPYSRPALEKVLPTVVIALTRSLFLKGSKGAFESTSAEYVKFLNQNKEGIKARVISVYGIDKSTDICQTIDLIFETFKHNLSNLQGERRLATNADFIRYDSVTDQIVTEIKNPRAVYNAPSQFVESILHDHIPTMQTLRNVESSSKVRIKSY